MPYIVIAVMGGGTDAGRGQQRPRALWVGGGIVSLVVMSYVFFGGMRGTAWVNTFQTVLFLSFGRHRHRRRGRRHGWIPRGDGVALELRRRRRRC